MFYYKIAEIIFCIEGDWPQLAQKRLEKYQIDPPQGGKYDVRYIIHQECDKISMPEAEKSVEVNSRFWKKRADGGYSMIDIIPEISEKILNRIDANNDWSEIIVEICREEICGIDKDMRAFNAFGETLPYVLFFHEGMVLHSSCIEYEGQAVLFSAPSGTGKSTHTRLWQKYYPETVIINDDLPALRLFDEKKKAYAYGTPWAGKTDINENICAPVRAIVFLKQATENSIRRISGAEAALLIVREIRKHVLEELMEASLDAAARLIELVPTYELSCNISKEAVDTAKNELFCG